MYGVSIFVFLCSSDQIATSILFLLSLCRYFYLIYLQVQNFKLIFLYSFYSSAEISSMFIYFKNGLLYITEYSNKSCFKILSLKFVMQGLFVIDYLMFEEQVAFYYFLINPVICDYTLDIVNVMLKMLWIFFFTPLYNADLVCFVQQAINFEGLILKLHLESLLSYFNLWAAQSLSYACIDQSSARIKQHLRTVPPKVFLS